MGTHSSILVWRTPWSEEPDGPQYHATEHRPRQAKAATVFHPLSSGYERELQARMENFLSESLEAQRLEESWP